MADAFDPPTAEPSGASNDKLDATRAHAIAHLRRAEGEIVWLRWIGMTLWLVVLLRSGFPLVISPVWAIYAAGIVYAAAVQWRLRNPRTIRTSAWVATIGDPLLAASMCHVTGGIASVFFPFLYFTLLAVAFRFGARETLAVLAINTTLTIVLFVTSNNPAVNLDMLVVAVLYLGFSAALGAMLAGWARRNLDLAMTRSEALRQAHQRSRSLLHRLIDAQEDERKRIAGDLHDGMGTQLFTLQQGLDECVRRSTGDPELSDRLRALATGSRACTTEMRALMNELRPAVLDDLGFEAALGDYVSELSESVPFSIGLELDPSLRHWRVSGHAILFRLVQEALLNVRKHAQARNVEIRFVRVADDVVLRIVDDGVGFDPGAAVRGHYGLLTMRERTEALGGTLELDSEPGWGTRIIVRLPFEVSE